RRAPPAPARLGRAARLGAAPEVGEDRDHLLDEPLVRTLRQRRVLARVALAEVVELRREALEPVEQLVALGLEGLDVEALLFGDMLLVGHGYAFGASSGSSMTS